MKTSKKINCKREQNKSKKPCLTSVRAIISRGNKVLLAQRTEKGSLGGYWEFVGGKTDGQVPRRALIREVKEETGLKIKNIKPSRELRDGKYFVKYFRGEVVGHPKMQASEVQGIGWFTRAQAKKLPLVRHTRRLI
jgi:8-oxo-dGTP diphosphatase